jgi:uncharacterized membrane protein
MTIQLLAGDVRIALTLAGVALLAIAFVLRWRRVAAPLVVLAAAAGMVALGAVLGERLAVFVAGRAAPDTTDYNEYRWIVLAPWGRLGLALGCGAAALVVALGWRASARIEAPWRRAAVVGLRTGAAAAALVLFLEPALELRQVAREPNRIAVLVDESASMALRDEPGGATRAEIARSVIERSASTFSAWEADHILDFYTFADVLSASVRERVAAAEPMGTATLLREALEQTRARYEGRDLAGVVVLSDGVPTGRFLDGAGDGASIDFLHSLDTHVHTAWIGKPGLKDVAVAKLLADEFAFVRTAVKVEAVIRATGYEKRRIPVTLSSEGRQLRQKWIDIGPGATTTTVSFEFTPARVGKFVYEIWTPVTDDEAVVTNNTRAFVLRVIRDKIRVLQVAGQPSWDVRALRRMLKQNPNVDLISFFILRTHEDLQPVPQDEMSLIPFPTQELFGQELPSFDLIILQNFNFLPYGIGQYLDNIRAYVDGGGGLIMLGGEVSFSSGLYAGTPVADTLPVDLLPNGLPPSKLLDTREFSPKLTSDGEAHPIAALRYESADNVATWRAQVPLEGVNLVGDAKPDATVIAVHPTLTTASGKPMPVIASGEYGKGRSLVVTTDSLWRWGFVAAKRKGDDGRHYHKLWENAIRWAIQDPELRYLHVETDAPEYYADSPLRVDVRLLDRDYSPLAGGKVSLSVAPISEAKPGAGDVGDPVQAVPLVVDDSGEASHEIAGLSPGVYRVTATAEVGGRPVKAVDMFLVRAGSVELEDPAASSKVLERISAATGGRFLGRVESLPRDLKFSPPRVVRVDRRSDIELWSRPWLLAAALLLLGLEWGLRQRSGYL